MNFLSNNMLIKNLILALLLLSNFSLASRKVSFPVYWHDWYYITTATSDPSAIIQRCLDLNLVNLSPSSQNQTVTLKIKTLNSAFRAQSSLSSLNPFSFSLFMQGNPLVAFNVPGSSVVQTKTIVLNNSTSEFSQTATCANYSLNSTVPVGDWHISGAFKVEIEVAEAIGAISAHA